MTNSSLKARMEEKKNTRAKISLIFIFTVVFIIICTTAVAMSVMTHSKVQAEKENLKQIEEIKMSTKNSNEEIERLQTELDALNTRLATNETKVEKVQQDISRGQERAFTVTVTAYDLSEQSCGKGLNSPGYGITASGCSLAGQSRESAMAIAVDPSVIPLGSRVRIKFKDPECQQYNGIYTAVDTGGAINGNHVDLFFGDFQSTRPAAEALRFGRRAATAIVL